MTNESFEVMKEKMVEAFSKVRNDDYYSDLDKVIVDNLNFAYSMFVFNILEDEDEYGDPLEVNYREYADCILLDKEDSRIYNYYEEYSLEWVVWDEVKEAYYLYRHWPSRDRKYYDSFFRYYERAIPRLRNYRTLDESLHAGYRAI